jgi:hypothetical protein
MDPFMSDMAGRVAGSAGGKVGASVIEKVWARVCQVVRDQFTQIELWSEYERRYIDRYGKVKLTFSGMREAVPLEQIYTGVHFLDGLSIGRFTSIEALEKGFRETPRRFQQHECSTEDGIAVANQHPFLMVMGGPGAGKSTYLRRVGLEALKGKHGNFQHARIPVMLELKRFNGELKGWESLKAFIDEEFRSFGFDFSPEFVEKLLKQGELLILLDGVDEVPKANQDKVTEAIQGFVSRYNEKYQGNRFIASCRRAAFRSEFTKFKDIELADFDDEQIKKFISNWFHSELDQARNTAEKCWILLNDSSNATAKELAQTPLLLTYLCAIYSHGQSFPETRVSLYKKILDIFLELWITEDQKPIHNELIYEKLNIEQEKKLLAEIAYRGFVEDRLFFRQDELISHIQEFLKGSVEKIRDLDGKSILTAIVVQQGILTERAEEIYSFSHLTLQEYLVAQYLSQNLNTLTTAVTQQLLERRWREVFLLVSGLLPNADDLLTQMATVAQQQVRLPKLQALLKWANQVTVDSDNPASPLIKRVVVLFFALSFGLEGIRVNISFHAHGLGYSLIRNHDPNISSIMPNTKRVSVLNQDLDSVRHLAQANAFNRTINLPTLIQELEALKLQIHGSGSPEPAFRLPIGFESVGFGLPLNIRKAFDERLLHVWCKGLGLDQELLNLLEIEAQALASYFIFVNL